ncbi:hypothetical protein [Pseudoroseicyclus sp. CXY001]|uniref:hypothetical protein n=1 Tax=Pseudoroseicyclus sp. CXY001 TaxID=3242492 RepID=UPI00358DC7CC
MLRLRLAAAAIARNAVLGVAALLCLTVGLGCLTAAAWIAIAAAQGHLIAALCIGGFWMLMAFVLVLILTRRPRPVAAPVAAAAPTAATPGVLTPTLVSSVAMAFAQGLGAGLSSRRPR